MLELKEKEGEFSRLRFCGDPNEIIADVICTIHKVYNELRKIDIADAENFKRCIKTLVRNGDAFEVSEE